MIVERKEWVKLQLTKFPNLRDNSEKLYFYYLKAIGYPVESKSATEFLMDMYNRKIPYLDSIARASRLIQEEHPHLRGLYWGKRKKKSVDVKHEILADKK
jgi:hypothetical protein